MERLRFKKENGQSYEKLLKGKISNLCTVDSSSISQGSILNDDGIYPIYGANGHIKDISVYHKTNKYIAIVKDGAGVGTVQRGQAYSSVIGTLNYIEAKSDINLDYLYYQMQQLQYNKYIVGSGIPHIYFKEYIREAVQVPSLPEQEKIGGFLSAIEELVDEQKEKVDFLKELKKGYLQKLFPKKGQKVPEVRFEGFADAWEQRKVSELIKDIADGPFGSNLKVIHYTDEKEARIIQLSNIGENGWQDENVRYTTFDHANEIKRCIVEQGELVMAKMMPAGLTIERPNIDKMYVLSSDAVRIRIDETKIDPKYFVYITKCAFFLTR